ncbi:MAG: N utilization substance protein B, partial [Parvularculaceae bacterium]
MQARTNARLAAVQALYQLETTGAGVETVVLEFRTHRRGGEIEGDVLH